LHQITYGVSALRHICGAALGKPKYRTQMRGEPFKLIGQTA
jgi:hypothetical protein